MMEKEDVVNICDGFSERMVEFLDDVIEDARNLNEIFDEVK